MGSVVAIIPARAGSKGIKGKNVMPFCGHPLIAWSIKQALATEGIDSVWVSSDGDEILQVAESYGARGIKRPADIAGDRASSESAWLHALDSIAGLGVEVDWVVAMQATSPIREALDLQNALDQIRREGLDSLLSVVEVEDFFMWRQDDALGPQSVNYDFRDRKPRQSIEKRYLENGSFYIFRPDLLRTQNNRLGGRIGMHVMEKHKMFQIDSPAEVQLCEAVMRGYGLDRI